VPSAVFRFTVLDIMCPETVMPKNRRTAFLLLNYFSKYTYINIKNRECSRYILGASMENYGYLVFVV